MGRLNALGPLHQSGMNKLTMDEINHIADEAHRELNRRFIERPLGLDGNVLAVGDETDHGRVVEFRFDGEWSAVLTDERGELRAMPTASLCRATVEDVLGRALCAAAKLDRQQDYRPDAADIAGLVNTFAPKMQLRGDAE